MAWYSNIFKPMADWIIALILSFLLFPVIAFLTIINGLVFKRPFFVQNRIGKNEASFMFYKFRSMKKDGDEASIPSWGRFMRKSSLDELPQLLNILRGEMSFVGPRPLLPEYLKHYSKEQAQRHLVKPGITGLAQVKGRNTLSWKNSLELDTYYSNNQSFALDFSILVQTVFQVFKFNEVDEVSGQSRKPFNKIDE
jgi:lipopolysaccharide/colanic/teichoic acid biosynthesis glycosyltransferase